MMRRSLQHGVSIIEALVGITLISLVLLFSVDAITQFLHTGATQIERTKALYLTEEMLETVRLIRDSKWSTTFETLPLNTNLYIDRSGATPTITQTAQTIDGMTPYFRLFAVSRNATTDDIVSSGGVADGHTRLMIATTTYSGGSVSLRQYVTDLTP